MAERKVSTIAFYDEEGKILLQDRKSISKFGEEWGFFGGSLEEGESPEQALIREIWEELTYKISNPKFFKSYSGILPNGAPFIEYVHLAKFPGYDVFTQKEGDGMNLFTVQEAREKLTVLPTYKEMLEDLELYLSQNE